MPVLPRGDHGCFAWPQVIPESRVPQHWLPLSSAPPPARSPRALGLSSPRVLTCPCCVQDCTLRLWEYRSGRELHCCYLTSLQEPAEPWGDKVTSRFCLGFIGACRVPLQSLGSHEQNRFALETCPCCQHRRLPAWGRSCISDSKGACSRKWEITSVSPYLCLSSCVTEMPPLVLLGNGKDSGA